MQENVKTVSCCWFSCSKLLVQWVEAVGGHLALGVLSQHRNALAFQWYTSCGNTWSIRKSSSTTSNVWQVNVTQKVWTFSSCGCPVAILNLILGSIFLQRGRLEEDHGDLWLWWHRTLDSCVHPYHSSHLEKMLLCFRAEKTRIHHKTEESHLLIF